MPATSTPSRPPSSHHAAAASHKVAFVSHKAALVSLFLAAMPVMAAVAATAAVLSSAPSGDLTADEQQGITNCKGHALAGSVDTIVSTTIGKGKLICFSKYISEFDTRQVDVAIDTKAAMGVPRWVFERVERIDPKTGPAETFGRPSAWYTVPALANDPRTPLAPRDNSYRFSKKFREAHGNWYERGHLAQKYLSERPPGDDLVRRNTGLPDTAGAGWFTHNLANAVPQRGRFNKGPWLTLECYTGAWANRYGGLWIISGPIFLNGRPTEWMRSDRYKEAIAVAVPDALFKVVVREENGARQALAFIYPQEAREYREEKTWSPNGYLTSLSQVSKLTGVDFLPGGTATAGQQDFIPLSSWKVEKRDFDPSCRRFAPEES